MCDTLVVLPEAARDGNLIFAKNSDRSPNEPLLTVRYPARDYDLSVEPDLKLTYITIPQMAHTHEVVLMKPSWMWGAEMGFNEFGLNIGNEAVFTRENMRGAESLTGMDMLRLTLERTSDAKSALDYMITLLSEYGQGGNCGYDHKFYYHNAFLIADRKEAYVLETAGKFYAAKKVKGFYAISNCLSLTNDYDFIHSGAVNNARKKRRSKIDEEFDFTKSYSDLVYTAFSKSRARRASAMDILEREKGNITLETVMGIMRSHSEKKKEDGNSVGSVCMHAGGLIGDHTTGSYIASLSSFADNYYVTASSLPCLSMYKPLVLNPEMPVGGDERAAEAYWRKFERLNRFLLSGQIDKKAYLEDRDYFEKKYIPGFEKATREERVNLMNAAWQEASEIAEKYLGPLSGKQHIFQKGGVGYRRYWKKKTEVFTRES